MVVAALAVATVDLGAQAGEEACSAADAVEQNGKELESAAGS